MHLFDMALSVDDSGTITAVSGRNDALEDLYATMSALCGSSLTETLGIPLGTLNGSFAWNGEHFSYDALSIPGGTCYCIKRQDHQQQLLQAALDSVTDGIQVYDADACAVYFNRASRESSGFSDSARIAGKYVMDLYANRIDEDYSTLLTTLRTQQAVHHRFADYKMEGGKEMVTINSGFPVAEDGQLVGAVIYEQNIAMVQDKIRQLEDLKAAIHANISSKALQKNSVYTFADIIGNGPKMRSTVEIAQRVAFRESNVLLVGETGTGKEIFARSIHNGSLRKEGKFVSINCAAVPETLIESILFGTTRGAFTGSQDKAGLFEEACDGTLFLDELNSMSLAMQSKLLRVLQEHTYRRIGGTKDLHTNARIVSACNEDPYLLITQNKIRRDLFYRLGTVLINIPPLRERKEDIEVLAYHRLKEAAPQFAIAVQTISPAALDILMHYDWPGNVRELNHAIDYAMNLCTGDTLLPEHLPPRLREQAAGTEAAPPAPVAQEPAPVPQEGRLQDLMDAYEEQVVRAALRRSGGNISQAAIALDIKRQSLQYRIHKYGIVL